VGFVEVSLLHQNSKSFSVASTTGLSSLRPASSIIKERKKIEGRLHVIEHELLSPRSRTNARNRSLRLALTFAEPDRRFPILVF
jgi:hypothetical protein